MPSYATKQSNYSEWLSVLNSYKKERARFQSMAKKGAKGLFKDVFKGEITFWKFLKNFTYLTAGEGWQHLNEMISWMESGCS